MTFWEFLIRLIEAVAWPSAAVFIVITFKSDLRNLLPFVRKLKAGPLEAEFEREVLEVKRESEFLEYEQEQVPDEHDNSHLLSELAKVNPRSAILESWLGLESALRKAAMQHAGSPPPNTSSPLQMIKELDRSDLLNTDEVALFHDLRGLRNQAAHLNDFNPSYQAAVNYVELATKLEGRLRKLGEAGA